MRRCKGNVYIKDGNINRKVDFELGYFHAWGCRFEEFETGAGNYSYAIVELPDGKIITPYPEDIEFLDPLN